MTSRKQLLLVGGLAAVVLLALLLGASDAAELKRRAEDVTWGWVALAGLASILSYAAISECQRLVLRVIGNHVPVGPMFRKIVVATTVNRTLRSGGASGFATLAWLLARRGVPAAAVLSATAGHSLLSNAVFALLFVWGAIQVLVAPELAGGKPQLALTVFLIAALAFVLLLAGTIVMLAWPPARKAWIGLASRIVARMARFVKGDALADRSITFFIRADEAFRVLAERWRSPAFGLAFLAAAARVGFSLLALELCLRATSLSVPLLVLLLGYTAGKVAGVLSFVPAGLGLVEASLTGVLHAFGVPYEAALLVALLNRVAYHLVPALLALAFAARLPKH